jgi:Ca2+-binding RTX toxin-like protein
MPTQIGANRAGNYIETPEADTIYGTGGNDTFNEEGGTDILTGARGNDQFLFDTALPVAGVDTIIGLFIDDNFDNDKIVLDKTVFSALKTFADNPLTAGDFSAIKVAATSEIAIAGNSAFGGIGSHEDKRHIPIYDLQHIVGGVAFGGSGSWEDR